MTEQPSVTRRADGQRNLYNQRGPAESAVVVAAAAVTVAETACQQTDDENERTKSSSANPHTLMET
jgi:hypothetical protein